MAGFSSATSPPPLPLPQSAALQEFAGELLALAGPLDPSAIAFDPASAFSSAAPSPGAAAAVASGSGSSGGRTQGGGTQTPAPTQGGRSGRPGRRSQGSPGGRGGGGSGSGGTWAAALALLADYLVDESVEVIRTAQYTLRLLLSTPEGQEALQQLDPALRPYLEAFRHGPGEPGAHKVAAGAAAQAAQAGAAEADSAGGRRLQLDSRHLWRCDGRPYDDWVCQLACAMLRKVRQHSRQGLQACAILMCAAASHASSAPCLLLPLVTCPLCVPAFNPTQHCPPHRRLAAPLWPAASAWPRASLRLRSCCCRTPLQTWRCSPTAAAWPCSWAASSRSSCCHACTATPRLPASSCPASTTCARFTWMPRWQAAAAGAVAARARRARRTAMQWPSTPRLSCGARCAGLSGGGSAEGGQEHLPARLLLAGYQRPLMCLVALAHFTLSTPLSLSTLCMALSTSSAPSAGVLGGGRLPRGGSRRCALRSTLHSPALH